MIQFKRLRESAMFIPVGIQIFGIFKEQSSRSFNNLLLEDVIDFMIQLTSQLREFVIEHFDNVEVVKDNLCIRQILDDSTDVSG